MSYHPYGAPPSGPSYYGSSAPPQQDPLQFYSSTDPAALPPTPAFYAGGAGGGIGGVGTMGNMQAMPGSGGWSDGGFWSAFGTGGMEGEPPLLEELGVNFAHIRQKTLTVLNPLQTVDSHIMDDADLAGPLIFVFLFALLLRFAGKSLFSNIYGLIILGDVSIYLLLNLMSPTGIDGYRTASVLGYCLLPLVLSGALGVVVSLDGLPGYLLSSVSIIWCSYSSSGIFVSVLRMSEQRLLVAYPVALFYASFAMLSVFDVGTGRLGIA